MKLENWSNVVGHFYLSTVCNLPVNIKPRFKMGLK